MQDSDVRFVAHVIARLNPVAAFLHELASKKQLDEVLTELHDAYGGGVAPISNGRYSGYMVRKNIHYSYYPLVVEHKSVPRRMVANKGFAVILMRIDDKRIAIAAGKATAGPLIGMLGGRIRELDQIAALLHKIAGDIPAFIIGDLNLYDPNMPPSLMRAMLRGAIRMDQKAFAFLAEQGFADMDASLQRPTDAQQQLRLDYAFVRGAQIVNEIPSLPSEADTSGELKAAFEVLSFQDLRERGMDHCPVVIRLQT